jgi:hypothetical protein
MPGQESIGVSRIEPVLEDLKAALLEFSQFSGKAERDQFVVEADLSAHLAFPYVPFLYKYADSSVLTPSLSPTTCLLPLQIDAPAVFPFASTQ